PAVAFALEERFVEAVDREKTQIATALSLQGSLVGRSRVRDALATEPPPEGAEAARLVRALRRNASAEDIGVLKSLFPSVSDDLEVDLELALALFERSDADVFPIVREALWADDFDISVLAGGLLAKTLGV